MASHTTPNLYSAPKISNPSVEEILECLKRPSGTHEINRICYIIVGKPGCGKTTLAKKLAAALNSELITPDRVLQQVVSDPEHPSYAKVSNELQSGKTIDGIELMDLMKDAIASEQSRFKGYILEGLPCNFDQPEEQNYADIRFLETIIDQKAPNHSHVLINLSISDENLLERRKLQWVDPITGTIYPGAQVDYTRKRRTEGLVHEDEDIEILNRANSVERALIHGADIQVKESADGEGDEESEEEASDEGSDDSNPAANAKKKEKPGTTLAVRGIWEVLPAVVTDRLLKLPGDSPENIKKELDNHKKYDSHLFKYKHHSFDELHVIEIDATQHPDTIFEDVIETTQTLGYSVFYKAVKTKRLLPPEGGFNKTMTEADIIAYLSTCELEPDEPPRDMGVWGRYCPVEFCTNSALSYCDFSRVIDYRGRIFCLSSDEAIGQFQLNPDKYITRPPRLPVLKICVIGGPMSGKSSQSKLLARLYDAQYIDIDHILNGWYSDPNQEALIDANIIYRQISRLLRSGKPIPPELYVEIYKAAIEGRYENDKLFPKPCAGGWVLDGFPKTLDQLVCLLQSGVKPEFVAVLQNGTSRCGNYIAHSLTGLAWEASSHAIEPLVSDVAFTPPLPIQMYPYFDNLYNGFKEDLTEMLKAMDESGVRVISTQADYALQTALSVIVSSADPFVPKAVFLTPKMQAELSPDVELGTTKSYCPYSLKTFNILHTGTKSYGVKYMGQLYCLSSEEARAAFIMEPHNYVLRDSPKTPPIRLAVLGPPASGKTTCFHEILKEWPGLPHLVFKDYLDSFAQKQEKDIREEIQYMVKENAGLLSPPILYKIGKSLFLDEPYASSGFVLEGFPRSKMEYEIMVKHGFHFDAYINMKLDPSVGAKRLLAIKTKAQDEKLRYFRRQLDAADDSGTLPPEEDSLEEFSETYGSRLGTELVSLVEKETSKVAEVVSAVETVAVTPIVEIDANKCSRPVIADMRMQLKGYMRYRSSIFSNAVTTERKKAEVLLQKGVKSYSRFGYYCPVELAKQRCTAKALRGHFPVVYRDHVYYMRTETNRKEFMENINSFAFSKPPPPVVRPTLCLLGRPKAGKSVIAEKMAVELDLVHLTIPLILQSILEGNETTRLHEKLKRCLTLGEETTTELVTEAIMFVTSRAISDFDSLAGYRWILDGYPITMEQANSLEKAGFLPHIMIELSITEPTMDERCWADYLVDQTSGTPRLNVPSLCRLRSGHYNQYISQIRHFYESTYANWTVVDGTKSKWAITERIKTIMEGAIRRRQVYLDLKSRSRWALTVNRSPACLSCAQQERFYKMAGPDELAKFLANPERYVSGRALPEALPIRRTVLDFKALFPKQLELQGYCPVMFSEGEFSITSIIPGDHENIVEYDQKLYVMSTKDALEKFMRTPWKYINLKLPKKLPPRHAPIPVARLPLIGFLEQTVAAELIQALCAVGQAKPKHPYKNLTASACEYVALYLKAHNPKAKEWIRNKFQKKLTRFEDRCELIHSIIDGANTAAACMATLRGIQIVEGMYVPQDLRVPGFDHNMRRFLELRQERNPRVNHARIK
ncbi:uncharacterized protein BJ171DRAFT_418965 [Polychytrium aggregatum]|uniref:uncharacterized protein n=1 Tax=Polychytrium aggregatum TaxID=110093 RepID=UPI0022FF04FF|nr:uncharacterized protein BJ171DRAFT_418965 [Polychytrium aggregatum]KAI9209033.1 hypothetical protein BJ171DRAFT_418965 [Polychytrium aggregatum]